MVTEAISPEFLSKLEARGVSRRSFMKLCGSLAVAAGLSELAAPRVARAIEDSVIGAESGGLYPAIWIEGASCTGCTESFAQVDAPDPATVVLEMVSLNYCETLSAAAGWSMEEAKAQTIEAGNYILIYEGAVLEGWNGEALRVANEPGTDHLVHAAENANAVVALGSCAVNGGWMGANPNSAGALGVQQYLKKQGIDTPVINIPGCPANPEWLEAVLVTQSLLASSLSSPPTTSLRSSSTRLFMTTVSVAVTSRMANSFTHSAPKKKPRATACIPWAAVVLRPRPTAVLSVGTIVVLGALLRAALASAAARLTPMILVRTGLKPTRPSAHASAICASVAWLSSLRQLLGRSPALWLPHSLSTALA